MSKTVTATIPTPAWQKLKEMAKREGRVFSVWLADQLVEIAAKGKSLR